MPGGTLLSWKWRVEKTRKHLSRAQEAESKPRRWLKEEQLGQTQQPMQTGGSMPAWGRAEKEQLARAERGKGTILLLNPYL